MTRAIDLRRQLVRLLLAATPAWFLLPMALLASDVLTNNREGVFLVAAMSAVTFGLVALRQSVAWRWIWLVAGTIATLLSALLFNFLQGRTLGVDSYNALFQTTLPEAIQFIQGHVDADFGLYLVLVMSLAPACLMAAGGRRLPRSISVSTPLLLTGAVSVVCASWPAGRVLPGFFDRQWKTLHQAARAFANEKQQFEQANLRFKASPSVRRTGESQPDLYIVMGESLSRHHFRLYGYPRETDVHLQPWKDSLIKFEDVVSGYSHTAESLTEVLSSRGFPEDNHDIEDVSLISILQAGGYNVTWLSNQNEYGVWDNPVSRHAKLSDTSRFFRKTLGAELRTDHFDHAMFMALQAYLPSTREVSPSAYFIHGYAGHSDYCLNIPAESKRRWNDDLARLSETALFGNAGGRKDVLDCYDSAVSYAAENLARVVDMASRQQRPSIVLFFSDHGENVLDGTGHEAAKHSHRHLEVPLLVYFNEAAKQERADSLKNAWRNRERSFELGDFFHSVVDLAGLQTPHAKPGRSLFSGNLEPINRLVLPREGTFVAVDEPIDLEGMSNSADYAWRARYALQAMKAPERRKVCAHRANTFFRFAEAIRFFDCAEMDLVVDNDELWVFHPPAENPRLPASLLLAQVPAEKRVWLDVKNLTPDRLDVLITKLTEWGWSERKDRLLIETDYRPDSAAENLRFMRHASEGWRLSYYLPTDRGVACATGKLASGACNEWATDLRRGLLQSGFSHLSFDAGAWPFVSSHGLQRHFQIGTWDISGKNFESIPEGDLFATANWYIRPFASPYYH